MSKTYTHQRAHAERAGTAPLGAAPFQAERWGDARHLRARIKAKARRSERHALADPMAVMEGAAPDLPHHLRPTLWRHPKPRTGG